VNGALTPDDASLNARPVEIPADVRPTLFVVVDTEEAFDWSAPFSRAETDVRAVRSIHGVHRLLARYGIKPTYVIDYPVAANPEGYGPLKELADANECVIGAHLHPWVNPPFVEDISARNSFACNLGTALEQAKLRTLAAMIRRNFGREVRVYKAGRYGFGRSTVTTLECLDFSVDLSINPHMDFSASGGPSFANFDASPFWFGRSRRLLEIPCTGGYVGTAGSLGRPLHQLASTPAMSRLRAVGILSRLGLVNRIMLSPEGNSASEMRQLTASLLAGGVRTFTLTFHSPSAEPGHTPYVRQDADLRLFLSRIESFCDFFFGTLGGCAATPEEFCRSMLRPVEGRPQQAHRLTSRGEYAS
jgi:hypothetical protein